MVELNPERTMPPMPCWVVCLDSDHGVQFLVGGESPNGVVDDVLRIDSNPEVISAFPPSLAEAIVKEVARRKYSDRGISDHWL